MESCSCVCPPLTPRMDSQAPALCPLFPEPGQPFPPSPTSRPLSSSTQDFLAWDIGIAPPPSAPGGELDLDVGIVGGHERLQPCPTLGWEDHNVLGWRLGKRILAHPDPGPKCVPEWMLQSFGGSVPPRLGLWAHGKERLASLALARVPHLQVALVLAYCIVLVVPFLFQCVAWGNHLH